MSAGDHDRGDHTANARVIEAEVAWFLRLLERRLNHHAGHGDGGHPLAEEPPPLPDGPAPYADVVRQHRLGPAERLVLALAAMPHIRPSALDMLLLVNAATGRRFTEFGGVAGGGHSGFLPTAETALFLLAGEDVAARLAALALFDPAHPFQAAGLLALPRRNPDDPPLSAPLLLTDGARAALLTGRVEQPGFGVEFPAQRLTTPYGWNDLVLADDTMNEVIAIADWARHRDTLMEGWGLRRRIKPGLRGLFHGSPGTGKSLTAALLGKRTGLPVYRVDLSKVVSKYIGETEKNLAGLFDQAEHRDWILFFDEAEALFGKRGESRNANDRAANQQIAYLLQRIEDFPGVVLLATNQQGHMDEAFFRRFQSVVHFRPPDAAARLKLWQGHFKDAPYRLATDMDLRTLARDHEATGGAILNALRHACLRAAVRGTMVVSGADLIQGLRRERHKEGQYLG